MKGVKHRIGISLIVLIVTIIVMIILAGAVIIALNKSGIFTTANKATLISDLKSFQEKLEVYKTNKVMNDANFDESTLFAYNNMLTYNTITEEEQNSNIYTILPEAKKYGERVSIESGKLVFDAKGREVEWCSSIGINVSGFYIEDGVLKSVTGIENLIDSTGTLVLPSTVKEIADGAFSSSPELKHLIIPGTVEKIRENAFRNNIYLETVEMQDGLKTIGGNAFYGCKGLKKVVVPDSVTVMTGNTFQWCTSLEDVKLSNNIKTLSAYMFNGCQNLKSITIPEKVNYIGEGAFGNCSQLVNIHISKNINYIGKSAFAACNSLTIDVDEKNSTYKMIDNMLCTKDGKSVIQVLKLGTIEELVIPDGVEKISLASASNLVKLVVPASMKEFISFNSVFKLSEVEIDEENQYYSADANAIYNKDKTKLIFCFYKGDSYTVRDGVKTIGNSAFGINKYIKEITFPESLETLEKHSVYKCTNLNKMYIGKSLINMDGAALYGLPALTDVTISSDNENFKVEEGMVLSKDGKVLIKVLGNVSSIDVPNTVTTLSKMAFNEQTKLTLVVFKEGLKEIGDQVFENCTSLTRVELPSTLTTISSDAFRSTTTLKLSEIVINKPQDSIPGSPWRSSFGKKSIIWVG